MIRLISPKNVLFGPDPLMLTLFTTISCLRASGFFRTSFSGSVVLKDSLDTGQLDHGLLKNSGPLCHNEPTPSSESEVRSLVAKSAGLFFDSQWKSSSTWHVFSISLMFSVI